MANEKFYLNCPYSEKDEAKALGAWWDTNKKKWYVPEGMDEAPFERWFPNGSMSSSDEKSFNGKKFSDFPLA